jgi:hypothetical protein
MTPNSSIEAPELANGGSADYYRKMDRRLIVLETRFDTILPNLATKTDLIELKAELKADIAESRVALRAEMRSMHSELKASMQKFITTTIVSLIIGFGGMLIAMATLLRPG